MYLNNIMSSFLKNTKPYMYLYAMYMYYVVIMRKSCM